MRRLPIPAPGLLLAACLVAAPARADHGPGTFSIVAFDSVTGELGVAVESKYFSVGRVVPWAEAGVGAVATQANVNPSYGPKALAMMRAGMSPAVILKAFAASDSNWDSRQLGLADAHGRVATWTGPKCNTWAGGEAGVDFVCQGNILAGPAVVAAMAKAFRASRGELAERLVAALEGGQAAGGDTRGQQSAALIVVKKDCGVWLHNDTVLRLQVDDNPEPIKELRRLVEKSVESSSRARRARPGCAGVNGAPK